MFSIPSKVAYKLTVAVSISKEVFVCCKNTGPESINLCNGQFCSILSTVKKAIAPFSSTIYHAYFNIIITHDGIQELDTLGNTIFFTCIETLDLEFTYLPVELERF